MRVVEAGYGGSTRVIASRTETPRTRWVGALGARRTAIGAALLRLCDDRLFDGAWRVRALLSVKCATQGLDVERPAPCRCWRRGRRQGFHVEFGKLGELGGGCDRFRIHGYSSGKNRGAAVAMR